VVNEITPAPQPPSVREVNLDAIVELLRSRKQTTRTELIRLSGLSKATVSGIVAQLADRGLVREVGKVQQGRGRSRILLEFNSVARAVLGAQIDDTSCTVVLADLDAAVQRSVTRRLPSHCPEDMFDAVTDAVAELRRDASAPVLGLGVGAPGNIDRTGRRITVAVSHGWRDLPIADVLEERVGLPVVAANRAKVAALGHLRQGDFGGGDNLVYVFLGSGIIAGIVMDGRLCFGRDGAAGDIGHVTVQPDGPLCGCGNRGCLHTVAAEDAILALAREKARQHGPTSALHRLSHGRLADVTVASLAEAAADGDAATIDALAEVGAYVGLAVANLVNTLNPDAVVIGGPSARLGEPLLGPIRREVQRRALADAAAKLDIVAARNDDEAGAIGGCVLWTRRMLSTPVGRRVLGAE
jgi:glucokinase